MNSRIVTTVTALGLVLSPGLMKLSDAVSTGRTTDTERDGETVCVGGGGAIVRTRNRDDSRAIGQLDAGARVRRITKGRKWCEIAFTKGTEPDAGWTECENLSSCETARGTASAAALAEGKVTARTVHSRAEVQGLPKLHAGEYRIHLIDVGTGLSVLLQGSDFNMLFDAGSKDDGAGGPKTRALAYLYAAIGPSGGPDCVPEGDAWGPAPGPELTIDHLVLSHPHDDHGLMLDEILKCYAVKNVWDSGAVNDADFYETFVRAVAAEHGVTYHTALSPTSSITVNGNQIALGKQSVTFNDGQVENLGAGDGAGFTILHADATVVPGDFNPNSIVMRVDLGGTSLLLTGDAESGVRADPADGALGDVERHLVDKHLTDIDVDILQVGHHGSKTSSRLAFLKAVSPKWALIGSGTRKYGPAVRLPDKVVVDTLRDLGVRVLSTKKVETPEDFTRETERCDVPDRIGLDNDKPGGCENHVLDISSLQ